MSAARLAYSQFLDLSRHLVVLQYFVICSWSKLQYFLMPFDAEIQCRGLAGPESDHLLVEILVFLLQVKGLEAREGHSDFQIDNLAGIDRETCVKPGYSHSCWDTRTDSRRTE
jgi:hypothetical protein